MEALWGIVALGRGNEIGVNGVMPWHLPEDLRHFKTLTSGHPVIMGRTTWESLFVRPLPGRRNIVLSRQPGYEVPGAETAASLAEAMELCAGGDVPFIIGGGRLYAEALPLISRLYVTRVEADFPYADTFFPDFSNLVLSDKSEVMESKTGLRYRFETYESGDHQ